MREIVLCDNGRCAEARELCDKYSLSVNADAFTDPDFLDTHPDAIERHLAAYAGIKIRSMHGPYRDLCLGSKDNLIKSATMSRFEYAFQVSKKLSCTHIVLHHGYVPATSYPPNWVKRAKSFFDEFLEDKPLDTVFHLENQLEHTPDLLSEVVSAVSDRRLDICLDVGHANCNSKTHVVEWIRRLGNQIGFVHLHNNSGQADEHLGFVKGSMNLGDVCAALCECAPNAIWAIETDSLSDAEQSVNWLIRNGFLAR